MAGTVEKLIGDDEVQRFVFFLQRSDGGNGNDALDSKLLEAVNVGAEVQLRRQQAMTAPMPGQGRDFPAFEIPRHICIRRIAGRSLLAEFVHIREAGHVVQPAAANDADFRLRQTLLLKCWTLKWNW